MKQLKIIFLMATTFLVGCSYLVASTATTSCMRDKCKVVSGDIYFTYQKSTSDNQMLITMSAKTDGWVSVGFGATNDMKDANIIMGYIDKNNQAVISNEYGVSQWSHKSISSLDAKSEIKLISGSYKDGWTTIRFTMPLISSDKKYGKAFKSGSNISVILAYGKNGQKNFNSYHAYRAKGEIVNFHLP
ncbi:DOMON domain-containing protein [Thiotrichales bacterium 19S9-12]|nr:DOMON domain-containing protein [Thiotrichales bacterium 19S9-11]MCF6811929.1 DOMON domain-containing protein [Thiotrichales bacterium 19S9-12]